MTSAGSEFKYKWYLCDLVLCATGEATIGIPLVFLEVLLV